MKAKFKPMDASFAEIPTPKQVLEHSLSRITTLTAGAVVPIAHGGSTYFLKVTELKTESGGDFAGCLLDTNLEAEFEQADNFVKQLRIRETWKISSTSRMGFPEVLNVTSRNFYASTLGIRNSYTQLVRIPARDV